MDFGRGPAALGDALDPEIDAFARAHRRAPPTYWLTRALFLRALGFIYFVAFLSLYRQLLPLLGSHGLLPIPLFVRHATEELGGAWPAFKELPSIFLWRHGDAFLRGAAAAGLGLSLGVLLGFANAPLLAALWFLYMSFVHVGQTFYGFGWEILLLETGFLAIFVAPAWRPRLLEPWSARLTARKGALPAPTQAPEEAGALLDAARSPPSAVPMWLLRWTLFRVMFGAGLIKIRGDSCWRDLTCLFFHYETQPLPNPLSWLLHQSPPWLHKGEVLWNHLVELPVPFLLLGPRRLRTIGGALTAAFQVTLILSGNLSFLNWLTLAITIPCFDDATLGRFVPARLRERVASLAAARTRIGRPRQVVSWALAAAVAYLSIDPVANLLSSRQVMNSSFDALQLVNTYGAFGSVGRDRDEIVLEGTDDTDLAHARWREYDFPCKPGDVNRRPCVCAPYQYRVDWEIWFAAMSDYRHHAWLVHLCAKLLDGDTGAATLLANNPFPRGPPHAIRARLYRYRFTRLGDRTRAWWTREYEREWMPAVTKDDPSLRRFLAAHGWEE